MDPQNPVTTYLTESVLNLMGWQEQASELVVVRLLHLNQNQALLSTTASPWGLASQTQTTFPTKFLALNSLIPTAFKSVSVDGCW